MTKKQNHHVITPFEKDRIIYIHAQMGDSLWRSIDVKEKFNLHIVSAQRYTHIGVKLGIFKIVASSRKPGFHNVYQCLPVDDVSERLDAILEVKKVKPARKIQSRDTPPCELANVLGLRPIQHDCNPRLVINDFRGGKIERSRNKVFVSGEWKL